jgi:hypothetical protein
MIKIEVTGASIPEVADKLMAIGRSLYNTAVNDADNAAREAMQARRNAAKPEVAEAAPADPTPATAAAETVSSQSGTATAQPETTARPEIATTVNISSAGSASVEPLSFEKDVAPVVLRAVATKGKPFVEAVMTEFGVARASQLDAARWPELIERLEGDA